MKHENTGIGRRAKRYQAVITFGIRIFTAFSIVYTLLSFTGLSNSSSFCDNRDPYNAPIKMQLQELDDLQVQQVEDSSIAVALSKKVRVLCWIMTTPANHLTKAIHVRNTWGKRCNILLFMSTKKDKYLPTIKLAVSEGKRYLWGKTKAAFRYVYKHYRNKAEWFLKADDDTFVILENLRYLLADYNSSDPVYLGHSQNRYTAQGYMTGGAGYVLSREALSRFVNLAVPNPSICRHGNEGTEDVEMGKCLDNIGVIAEDTRDSQTQFYPFDPETHLLAKFDKNSWYTNNDFYARDELVFQCCARHAVSFHYITASQMYYLEYVLYRLRPYGLGQKYHRTPNIIIQDSRK